MTHNNETHNDKERDNSSAAPKAQHSQRNASGRPVPPPGYNLHIQQEQEVDTKNQEYETDIETSQEELAQSDEANNAPQYSKNVIFKLDLNNKHLKRISSLVFVANIFALVSIFLDIGVILCAIAVICALFALNETKKLVQSSDEALVLIAQNIIRPVKTTLLFSTVILFLDAISLIVLWYQMAGNLGEAPNLENLKNLILGLPEQTPADTSSNLWG